MAGVHHVEFWKFRVFGHRTSVATLLSTSLCKLSLKSENQLLSYGRKTIFKMAAVHHLEF